MSDKLPSIHGLTGQTHTVEVHPDIDHLHNVKSLIQSSGKPHMQLADIKRSGVGQPVLDRLPRDSRGKVTPEMIDKHIESLPKQKVEINVAPYEKEGWQQHRKDVPQYLASVGLHGDTIAGMSDRQKKTWDHLKNQQHDFDGQHEHQVGWARVDPYKMEGEKAVPNDNHWHLDEIQSDLHSTKDKLGVDPGAGLYAAMEAENPKHPLHAAFQEAKKTGDKDKFQAVADKWAKQQHDANGYVGHKEMDKVLGHGHEDAQHLVHSAINALARKHGIKSTSMLTPEDSHQKSQLNEDGGQTDYSDSEVPAHQVAVYKKRPKKLGATTVDKQSVLGKHPEDKEGQQLQYMKLSKNLQAICDLLKKA